jgi:hypothetical protein
MQQKMANSLEITVDGADLTTVQTGSLEVYLRQGDYFRQYIPTVIDADTLLVNVPKADAQFLKSGFCRLQLAYRDANGTPQASQIAEIPVAELLKGAGYGN